MENPTYITLSRLDAQQRAMDVIASNISNANTDGYRAQRVLFSDYLSAQRNTSSPTGGDVTAYTQDRATYLDQSSGNLTATGNPLDLAVIGNGFFTVSTAAGPRLTRSGHFGLLPTGQIADASGDLLLDKSGAPLQISSTDQSVQITADGTVSTSTGIIGQIGLVTVTNTNMLVPEGSKLYRSTADTVAAPATAISQGSIEASNVQPISELTLMMKVQREFQFVSQFIESEGTRQQNSIDKIVQQQS